MRDRLLTSQPGSNRALYEYALERVRQALAEGSPEPANGWSGHTMAGERLAAVLTRQRLAAIS